jgi:hypothetical protein
MGKWLVWKFDGRASHWPLAGTGNARQTEAKRQCNWPEVLAQPAHCTYDTHSTFDESFHSKVICTRFEAPESCPCQANQSDTPILTIAAHRLIAALTPLSARAMLDMWGCFAIPDWSLVL